LSRGVTKSLRDKEIPYGNCIGSDTTWYIKLFTVPFNRNKEKKAISLTGILYLYTKLVSTKQSDDPKSTRLLSTSGIILV